MRIGIAGYGYVGMAHEAILERNTMHQILISDPAKNKFADLRHCDAIIVAVATPQAPNGSCQMEHVFDVVDASPDVPILIKSTISVEGWKTLIDAYPNKEITFSPEFLRANSWKEDALNTKEVYMGGGNSNFWSDIFLQALGPISISIYKAEELVAAKALRNNFLALKVSFFNQVYDYCKAHELNYTKVAEAIGADNRIGQSHTGVTEQRGFGGHCFPKDIKATIQSGKAYNSRFTLLEEALAYNDKIRKD